MQPPAARTRGPYEAVERWRDRLQNQVAPAPDAPLGARLAHARGWAFVAAADAEYAGASPLDTGAALASCADDAIRAADETVFAGLQARWPRGVGRAVIALGKLGTRELNPSSDIDLLFVHGACPAGVDPHALHDVAVRWARRVRAVLSDVSAWGAPYRVDLDLRPEGTRGPLVNGEVALERFYERFGRPLDRLAWLRARPVVDVGGVGERVVRALRPFVYPRTQDGTLATALRSLRERLVQTAPKHGFDVKRSRGALRDVEFAVQALQLVRGGRLPRLRGLCPQGAAAVLAEEGLLGTRQAEALQAAYLTLRRVEHALQYDTDRQVTVLPADAPALARIGEGLRAALGARWRDALHMARADAEAAFADSPGHTRDGAPEPHALMAVASQATDEARTGALASLGFTAPARALRQLRRMAKKRTSPFSPLIQRVPAYADLAAHLVQDAADSPAPDLALDRIAMWCGTLRHRALLEHLAAEPVFRRQIVRLSATSAYVAGVLSRQHAGGHLLTTGLPLRRASHGALRATLDGPIASRGEREDAMVRMRRVHGQVAFGVAAAFLSGRATRVEVGHRLSRLADVLVQRALAIALARTEARRGSAPEGFRMAVLGLGALGGRTLGFLSDLDVLFVYDAPGADPETGAYAVRVAQAVIAALSTPLAEGRCYEVDARLRPSGSQGPLCVSRARMARYHSGALAVWEQQAMLRLRPVAGDRALGAAVRAIAWQPRLKPGALGSAVSEMWRRVQAERGARAADGQAVLKAGAGGLLGVELAVQGLVLHAGGAASAGAAGRGVTSALSWLGRTGVLSTRDVRRAQQDYLVVATFREARGLALDGAQAPLHDAQMHSALARVGAWRSCPSIVETAPVPPQIEAARARLQAATTAWMAMLEPES